MSNKLSQRIINFFQSDTNDCSISRQNILDWMNSEDIQILGVLYSFITKPKFSKKIQPPLEFDQYYKFIKRYLELCIYQNPDNDDWVKTRYEAGWELVSWFASWWDNAKVPKNYLKNFKNCIGDIYKKGNQQVKECIVNATLEHLFENKKVIDFFSDWQDDPELQIAYIKALEWVKKGGYSPKGFGFGEK
jgi:hypothetical protein